MGGLLRVHVGCWAAGKVTVMFMLCCVILICPVHWCTWPDAHDWARDILPGAEQMPQRGLNTASAEASTSGRAK